MAFIRVLFFLAGIFVFTMSSGCGSFIPSIATAQAPKSGAVSSPSTSAVEAKYTPIPTATPIQFAKGKIRLGGKTVVVEFADNDQKREHGLMFREKLDEDTGMIFIFDREERLGFWMKNTLIPLSIGYFDRNRKLVDIHEMVPAVMGESRPKTYPSRAPAMYAIEMPKGWYSRNGVKVGATFTFVDRP